MKKVILTALAALAVAGMSFGMQILDTFDFANYGALTSVYSISGNDVSTNTATMTVAVENTIKTEGTGSVRIDYAYSGKQWYEAILRKTFATPQDFGVYNKYKFDMYVADSTQIQVLVPYIKIFTNSNNVYRKVWWTEPLKTGWNTVSLNLTDMEIDPWTGVKGYSGANLKGITAIDFVFQVRSYDTTNPKYIPSSPTTGTWQKETATFYLDNFRGYELSDRATTAILENFNFANDSVFNATYSLGDTTALKILAHSLDSTSYFNDKSIKLVAQVSTYWSNCESRRVLPAVQNFTSADYAKIWFKGDYSNQTTAGPLLLVALQDTTFQRAWFRIPAQNIINGEWQALYYPISTTGSSQTLFNDDWDLGDANRLKGINLAIVDKFGLYTQTQVNNINNIYTMYIDQVEFSTPALNILNVTPYEVTARPSGVSVSLTATGMGPFTWALSSGILGTLSATTGATVTFTPGSSIAEGTLSVTDQTGETFLVPIKVNPTAAPMATELFE